MRQSEFTALWLQASVIGIFVWHIMVPSREAIMLGISGEYATISLSFENILVPSANFSLEPSIEFGPHHT
jgi:hypothetical protein